MVPAVRKMDRAWVGWDRHLHPLVPGVASLGSVASRLSKLCFDKHETPDILTQLRGTSSKPQIACVVMSPRAHEDAYQVTCNGQMCPIISPVAGYGPKGPFPLAQVLPPILHPCPSQLGGISGGNFPVSRVAYTLFYSNDCHMDRMRESLTGAEGANNRGSYHDIP